VSGENVIISIHTQVYGENWKKSHTHIVDKSLLDAYIVVVKNDMDVTQKEEEGKTPKGFSLDSV
jgi:hypothetical protein